MYFYVLNSLHRNYSLLGKAENLTPKRNSVFTYFPRGNMGFAVGKLDANCVAIGRPKGVNRPPAINPLTGVFND